MRIIRIILSLFGAACFTSVSLAGVEDLTNRLENLRPQVVRQFSVPVEQWRFHQPAVPSAEQPDFDDSSWQSVSPGFSWEEQTTNAMLRAHVTIPATVAGLPVEGMAVRLQLGVNEKSELFVNGKLRDDFRGDSQYTLSDHAHPGQTFSVTLQPRQGQREDRFRFARIYCDVLPDFDHYLDEVTFVSLLMPKIPANEQAAVKQALSTSENCIQFTNVTPDNLDSVRTQLAAARAALLPVAAFTKKYDVYYVGHAHIDMNWLWTWPETIDVCHRTWNSAMNLMDEFPEFRYVQSQPAAHVPIESEFPDEFARMQAMSAKGQWDLVGGMWNESDTDIPSGEGLARSFLLGQRYFKSKFGKYAVTGWLPDSFGHTWQLPQIMKLSGIQNFYHMRCGNGMEFAWWQSPDGSRVLKANTQPYNAKPLVSQLVMPMENEARFNLPQSLVIFGVGDHGGGPTREQILRIQSFQKDPIFPRVHFIDIDDFFDELAKQPVTASLPVVDTDLQYTFEGCYTTHADLKKELRQSENNLYSAEALGSLAAMTGQPYPVAAFDEAWKPTTFAQFHDIACGSAIHSTYDWMHEQLVPAFKIEQEQTDKSLNALTALADTRGPGTNAIAVWNTLSFKRDDVVRVLLASAARYHSVVDSKGRRLPAQVDGNSLVFVARAVPAFGHAVYFPDTKPCSSDGINLRDAGDVYEVKTPELIVQINKTNGAMTRLYSESAKWNVLGDATGNALQLLGDSGTAWTIRYTGTNQLLTTEGARVSVVDDGPVFVRLRVNHALGKSSYTQDVTVYGALPRVDVPTTVDWQEQAELLKIRLPIAAAHPEANAQIPSGSMTRPTNGQECPGQKWMDLSEAILAPVEHARPLDVSSLFNAKCTKNFDGNGRAYPADQLPDAGVHKLGPEQVPFKLPSYDANQPDCIAADGQELTLSAGTSGDTLYLLAACANGSHWTEIGFRFSDGRVESRAFALNDWQANTYPDNSAGLDFSAPKSSSKRKAVSPTMWIVQIPLPKNAAALVLPRDARVHFFAATIGIKPQAKTPYGLTVLNDCKYGFDVTSNVFRLTALRSSSRPDPTPDQGMQSFTYSLYPHAGDWRAAHADEQALALNIPLLACVTTPHPPAGRIPSPSIVNIDNKGDLVVSALKHSEDGNGFILRFYEADGQDTHAQINFDWPIRVEETDILERPLTEQTAKVKGNSVVLPVGHNQIITLHVRPAL
jgi:alpha-mannosidase